MNKKLLIMAIMAVILMGSVALSAYRITVTVNAPCELNVSLVGNNGITIDSTGPHSVATGTYNYNFPYENPNNPAHFEVEATNQLDHDEAIVSCIPYGSCEVSLDVDGKEVYDPTQPGQN